MAANERLLDEGIGREGLEILSPAKRVQDLINAFDVWSDPWTKRLREIYRMNGEQCAFCPKVARREGIRPHPKTVHPTQLPSLLRE